MTDKSLPDLKATAWWASGPAVFWIVRPLAMNPSPRTAAQEWMIKALEQQVINKANSL